MSAIYGLSEITNISFDNLDGMFASSEGNVPKLTESQEVDLKAVESVTSNSLLTIHRGMRSVGALLANIGSKSIYHNRNDIDSDLLDSKTLEDIGYMIDGLAGLAQSLSDAAGVAKSVRIQQGKRGAREINHG